MILLLLLIYLLIIISICYYNNKPYTKTNSTFRKCFAPNVLVKMKNGTTKPIKDIVIGDITKGGIVASTYVFQLLDEDVYNYKGIIVTGSHAVLEPPKQNSNSGKWTRVKDSIHGKKIESNIDRVYCFVCNDNLIYVDDENGYEVRFTDFDEITSMQPIYKDVILDKLNCRDFDIDC